MREYDAIVVGAGNAGITAACALQKDGVNTLLIERTSIPGGAATSFRRGRFEFESALHQIPGFGTDERPGPLMKMMEDVGVKDRIDWLYMDNIETINVPGMLRVSVPTDREKAVESVVKAFPNEEYGIRKFFDVCFNVWEEYQKIFQYNFDSVDPLAKMDPDASPEKYPYYYKYAYMRLEKFLYEECKIKTPLTVATLCALCAYSGKIPDCSVIDIAIWIYTYVVDQSVHIHGCSFAMSSVLTEKFREMGGTLQYNTGVTKLIVEDGAVVGVETEYGEQIRAKQVVSNMSPMAVYAKLMDPKDVPAEAVNQYKGYVPNYATFQLYLGLDCDAREIGVDDTNLFTFMPDGTRLITTCHDLADPAEAGSGKSTVTILAMGLTDEWVDVPVEKYYEAKFERAEAIMALAEKAYPGIREHTEEMEISTPVTNTRFMSSPGGSIGGFKTFNRQYHLHPMHNNDQMPGLSFVGQWNQYCGFYATLMNGYAVGHDIAEKKFGKEI